MEEEGSGRGSVERASIYIYAVYIYIHVRMHIYSFTDDAPTWYERDSVLHSCRPQGWDIPLHGTILMISLSLV
jgi:Ca2+/H+ antiporter